MDPARQTTDDRLTVEEYEGQRVLVTRGIIHSVAVGDADPSFGYWTAMLPERPPETALLLGLGAGTLAHLLTRRHPGVRITGVECDAELLAFARRHFDLDLPNLEIVLQDAFEFVARCDRRYDYIGVDLFEGPRLPRPTLQRPFLHRLLDLAAPSGEVVFNLLKHRRSRQHLTRIARILPSYRTDWLPYNVVMHCQVPGFRAPA
jgi:spermidine synthase